MPRIVAGGSRQAAYDLFCTAARSARADELPVLLVDSEAAVQTPSKWEHLKNRPGDGWVKPESVSEDQVFLMVQCMESWFLADRQKLVIHFGQGFRENALPQQRNVEEIPKQSVYQGLKQASRDCKTKTEYSKGQDSFQILGTLDPALIRSASPHADSFFKALSA
jgi:hypothetical protein